MKDEDYNLLCSDIERLEHMFASKTFVDPDGKLTTKLATFCKNNGIPFCRGCARSIMPTIHSVLQLLKQYNGKQGND